MRWQRAAVAVLAMVLAAGSGLGLGVVRAAAQDATPAAMTEIAITITATEFEFDGPSEVEAGLVSVTMDNAGEFRHHAQLFKIDDGTSVDDFVAGLETGKAFGLGTAHGGPATVGGGVQTTTIQRLDAGQYVVLCFVTGRDGVPHYMKGMAFPFTVAGEDAGAPDPESDLDVSMVDYQFELAEDSFEAGQHVWKVTNEGDENHELAILKLPEGMTADAYRAMMMAPADATPDAAATPDPDAPQPTAVGGIKALGPGLSGWVVADLEPGEYVAVCFIPDENGTSHAMLGMISGFTVR